jgi:hypothetical protein
MHLTPKVKIPLLAKEELMLKAKPFNRHQEELKNLLLLLELPHMQKVEEQLPRVIILTLKVIIP